jgi:hypothetical protein
LSKKSTAGGLTKSDFQLYYRAITTKRAWYWHKKRQEDQWIRIEDSDINPFIYSQLISDKESQKRQLPQQMLQENWTSTCRRLKLDSYLSTCTKINSKWIKTLIESLKLLKNSRKQ